jgi:glutathione S-transferase
MAIVYGVNLSPFVRKVRVFMAEKGLPYELEPIIPMNAPPEYRKISPLGKIPAYRDEKVTLADSSAICAYLERIHPRPELYPSDPPEYGRALWFEEYGDSALAPTIGPKIFFPKIVAPRFFNQPADDAAIRKVVEEELPPYLDYLEGEMGNGEGIVGGRFTIADIALGTQFVNLRHAGFSPDAKRWPRLTRYIERVHDRPTFKKLIAEETRDLGLAD